MSLPLPDAEASAHSARLQALIRAEIADRGWMPFSRYMECALYSPGLGYYSGALQKFGSGGDFITAPELSPLFGQCLATQIAQLMTLSAPHVMEAGAGSGRLAQICSVRSIGWAVRPKVTASWNCRLTCANVSAV
jgi:SAM-dependent MidA family methyltransferase